MATLLGANPPDARRAAPSPRPKGRENYKSTPCRNIGIYGFCRFENEGCMYNHEAPATTAASNAASSDRYGPGSHQSTGSSSSTLSSTRLNVESPSFTPLQPQPNGFQQGRSSALSPRSASAAPFTPKSSKPSPLASHARPKPTAPEWTPQEFTEFVPKSFDPAQASAQGETPYQSYESYNLQSTMSGISPSQPAVANPYFPDPALGTTAFYQPSAGFAQPLQYHLYAPLAPHRENLLAYQRTTHDFFISEEVRREFQKKMEATLQVLPNSALPHVDHFHSLVPLDTSSLKNPAVFGYTTWIYKATSSKDGKTYALRRLEGYRLTNELAVRCIQPWKRIDNAGIVTVHDVFTTRAFGDSSLMCVTDYHPCSTTISDHHFSQTGVRVGPDGRLQGYRPHGSHVPEQTIWGYLVQIASALKTIHSNGLAAQVLHPSKVLLTGKNRVRLGSCGIMDVVKFDAAQSGMQKTYTAEQQDDLIQLGKLILSVASGNLTVYINPHKTLEGISRAYSDRLRECITWLLTPQTAQPKDIDILLSEISGHAMTVLDNTMHAMDTQDSTLATSLEDGRIARLLMKINVILERPDEEPNYGWSDTGERYYIKLFRDYVFHAIDASGRPNVDLAHMIGCLNRLDAGSTENIQLSSRDGDAVFVVSFRDIKRAIESAFNELNAGAVSAPVPKRKLG